MYGTFDAVTVECDSCGQPLRHGSSILFNGYEQADNCLAQEGWTVLEPIDLTGDRHFCPKCANKLNLEEMREDY